MNEEISCFKSGQHEEIREKTLLQMDQACFICCFSESSLTLCSRYFCPHFTDGEIKTQNDWATYPRHQGFKPGMVCWALRLSFSKWQPLTLWDGNSLLWGVSLCLVGCLAESLASILDESSILSLMTSVSTTRNVSQHCQLFPQWAKSLQCSWEPLPCVNIYASSVLTITLNTR